ncbi:sugar porter family MFS transporter [Actinomadura rupiterrae]|uniref:sugar porter family MFS transporter n=1 Tax=Actinomadura rupiterrae TaxID=559627 RepID=UPI0020A4BB32|nr:sugar porter family MFS transporter [Actinomadura rupiterrae]MCP2338674.1 sugar porter (SP) family MFS transporter [Actinomadura rupiterrae]
MAQYHAIGGTATATHKPVSAEHKKRSLFTWAFFATLGSFLFGYDTGVVSGAILFVRQDFHLNAFMQGAVVSVLLLSAAATAPFAGDVADRFGRRQTLVATGVIFTIGLLMAALAPDVWVLLLARLILGAGVGAASAIVPVYLSEISPAKIRGLLTSCHQLMVTIGLLVSYIVDLAFSGSGNWRMMFGVGVIASVAMALGMAGSAESPAWLATHGRVEDAKNVLRKLYPESEVDGVVKSFGKAAPKSEKRKSYKDLWKSPVIRPALVIGVGLAALQQLSGINTIMYYAPTIMEKTGLNASNSLWYSIIIGVVNLLMTLVALKLTDTLGRRPLLIASASLMLIATIPLGLAFTALHGTTSSIAALCSIAVYIMAFAIGLGPIFWTLNSEIYPPEVRAEAASLGTMVNWLANFLVSQTFLPMSNGIGQGETFWVFGALCLVTLIFILKKVPETKGKTYPEIEKAIQQHA